MDEYPRLIDGIDIAEFDTSSEEPIYLLHLPNGTRFQISQDLHTVLRLLDGKSSVEQLACSLSKEWEREVSEQEIIWMINERLAPYGIIAGQNDGAKTRGSAKMSGGGLSLLFKIPLLSERHLHPIVRIGQHLFAKAALIALLTLGLAIHVPVYLHLQTFMASFSLQALSGYRSLTVIALVAISTLFHELGHLSACQRYGAQYGQLGIGMYFLSPVAYVDVTDSWRLPRWKRVIIDIGGMYFQWIYSIVLFGLYLLSRSQDLLLAIVFVDVSLVMNLNPMFKFDGYWALSDAIGVPNLHKRAGEMWRQLIIAPGKRPSSSFLKTHTYVKVVMWVYTLAVTVYIGYFAWGLVCFAPAFVKDYPHLIMNTLPQTWQHLASGEFQQALGSIAQIVFPTLLLVGLVFLVRRLMFTIYRLFSGKDGLWTKAT